MHMSTSKAPSTAKASAPVERCVAWLGLWATTTVVEEWTVVVGAAVVGVPGVVVVGGVMGVLVVGPAPGATVPGWLPFAGGVAVGVIAVDVVVVDVVPAAGGVLEAVAPCTRADAGIGIPKARSVPLVLLAAQVAVGFASRQHTATPHRVRARTLQRSHARTQVSPRRTTIISPC
jgi:hypothetical protein